MGEIKIERYRPDLKKEWNDFVESSKNGTFLLNREYMDYHFDRFKDNSFIFYHKDRIYCLLPANRKDDMLFSHQGLTYGGVIMNEKCTAEGILEVFDLLHKELKLQGIRKFIYKPIPHIYHSQPSEEDLYALFRHDASLIGRNISSTLLLSRTIPLSTLRKRMLKKANDNKIVVEISHDWKSYWEILSNNLKSKYKALPVHDLQEILSLAKSFPNNIKLYSAFKEGRMVGGVVGYISKMVVHTQYISANQEGKETGAIDAIIHHLLENHRNHIYLDLGTSNEDGGIFLNLSLIHQKEGFGCRATCYDTYEINI